VIASAGRAADGASTVVEVVELVEVTEAVEASEPVHAGTRLSAATMIVSAEPTRADRLTSTCVMDPVSDVDDAGASGITPSRVRPVATGPLERRPTTKGA